MILEGALKFSENDVSIIYTMNSPQTGQYCVVVPKNVDGILSMLVDISKKSLFDSLVNNIITKDELIEKINEEYKYVKGSYASGMLVIPMIDKSVLDRAVSSNDKQKMFDETKQIAGVTSEIFKKLTDSGLDKSKINQKIVIIENDDSDSKFVDWLKEQQPNFVDGIPFTKLKEKSDVSNNPFANVNPFTGEANGVGDEKSNSVSNDSIFGPPQNDSSSTSSVKNTDIFGSSTSTNEKVSGSEEAVPSSQSMFDPQPVNSVSLENNNSLVNDSPQSSTQPVFDSDEKSDVKAEASAENDIDKKSGGFANLLILLVILVVVTVISIELGKFLYNSFGA